MVNQANTFRILEQFKIRGFVPGGIVTNHRMEQLHLEKVPPFLRTLLVTDGTVTKSLEAYFWEQVQVQTLDQGFEGLKQDLQWLGLKKGESILHRQVRLQGLDSSQIYVFADSALRLKLLPERLRQDLMAQKIGIGEILRESGLETYREIVDMGMCQSQSLPPVFGLDDEQQELIYRRYRIVLDGKPVILISEYFPLGIYEGAK